MAGVTQPEEPVGLPTGNPWDLAYPLGHTPPVLKKEGGAGPEDPKGYIGEQVSDVAAAEDDVPADTEVSEDSEDSSESTTDEPADESADDTEEQ